MAKRYKIYDTTYVPGMGNGPFNDVIIPDNKAVQLKKLGIKIEEIDPIIPIFKQVVHSLKENVPTIEEVIPVPIMEEVKEPVVEEVIKEVETPKEIIEEVIPEPIMEEVKEPVVEETEEISITKEELPNLTNAQLKEILTSNEIEIPKNDTKSNLIDTIVKKLF